LETDLLCSRQQLVSKAILCCTGALLFLIGVAVYQHPASVFPGDLSAAAVTVAAMVVFGVTAACTLYAKTTGLQMALLIGAAVGALQGFIEMANIAFEYSPYGSKAVHTLAVPLSMALMILLFSSAGSLAYDRTSSLRLATVSGVWCAVVGTLLTGLFGFAYNIIQMPHMVEIMHTEFALSGLADPRAYVVRNTIDSASTHFFLAPILGAISGCIASFVSSQLRGRQRLVAVLFSAMSFVLLISSVALIRFGLTLARADRAPYISCGMIGSALALTCLWPATRAALSHHRYALTHRLVR
jgi:hypothetical protein